MLHVDCATACTNQMVKNNDNTLGEVGVQAGAGFNNSSSSVKGPIAGCN